MKRIIYKFLLFIRKKTDDAKIYYQRKNLILGRHTQIYAESEIYNLQNDINKIVLGNNTHIRGELLIFKYGGKIEIGDNTFVGTGSRIWSGESVKIGSNVLISHNVNIIDSNSHEMDHLERAEGFISIIKNGYPSEKKSILTSPIIIDDYTWISFNVCILKGVHIGKGAIIAAGSVVTKDVPEFCMAAGNPAVVVKQLK